MTQRIFAGDRNEIRTATIAASAVQSVPADQAVFPDIPTRTGNGAVALTGTYTGHQDATFDVLIDSQTVGPNPQISAPIFSGSGNGEMTEVSADAGATAQTITLTLTDLGTTTAKAKTAFFGVTLQAKDEGTAGNTIRLTLDLTGVIYTATDYATLDALPAGTEKMIGPQWDFGALPVQADGQLDPATPRIAFGDDPQVYRPYRVWEDDDWSYWFEPAIVRAVAADTVVMTVSGTYDVNVTDGASPEDHTGLVTLFDFLNALQEASELIEVVGVVAADRAPGGQAVTELPLRTEAFALPVELAGSEHVQGLDAISVQTDAPTESVVVTCTDNTIVGAEVWGVKGSISGDQSDAVTGVAYAGPEWGFTIPPRLPETIQPDGDFWWSGRPTYASRAEGEVEPAICMDFMILGAQAKDATLTLVYRQRPTEVDCACEDTPVDGSLSEECLGIELEEGQDMSTSEPGYLARAEDLRLHWYTGAIQDNTTITEHSQLRTQRHNVELAEQCREILLSCLGDLYSASAVRSWTAWEASTTVALYEVREPTVRNNYRYRAVALTGTGQTGGSEPTWPEIFGFNQPDNEVTWECVSKVPEALWDEILSDLQTNWGAFDTIADLDLGAVDDHALSTPYSLGDRAKVRVVDVGGAKEDKLMFLQCVQAGTSDAYLLTLDDSPSIGTLYNDGGVDWMFIGEALAGAEGIGNVTAYPREAGISRAIADFVKRYAARCNEVRAIAELDPKAEAGGEGSACWPDIDVEYWWEFEGSEHLPAYTNHIYHSVKRVYDADAGEWTIVTTQEFAFAIKVNPECIDHLKEGDTLTLHIGDVAQHKTYLVGDAMRLPIVAGAPLYLGGGVDGDDTHTWTVIGSTDGILTAYAVVDDSEVDYNAHNLHFKILRSGVPFQRDDSFQFTVEGGYFRWRRDGGAYSAAIEITDSPVSLIYGLSAAFTRGANLSFKTGDLFGFTVRQPWDPAHLQTAHPDVWRWSGSPVHIIASLGASHTISDCVLARHDLPAGTTLLLEGSTDGFLSVDWSEALTWRAGVIAKCFAARPATGLRLTITGASGARIGWWWAGQAWAPSRAADLTYGLDYALDTGTGVNASALFLGEGRSGELAWRDFLLQPDWEAIQALLQHVKTNDDEPLVVVPHANHPDEAMLVTIGLDRIRVEDRRRFQAADRDATNHRLISMTLPLEPVYA